MMMLTCPALIKTKICLKETKQKAYVTATKLQTNMRKHRGELKQGHKANTMSCWWMRAEGLHEQGLSEVGTPGIMTTEDRWECEGQGPKEQKLTEGLTNWHREH